MRGSRSRTQTTVGSISTSMIPVVSPASSSEVPSELREHLIVEHLRVVAEAVLAVGLDQAEADRAASGPRK